MLYFFCAFVIFKPKSYKRILIMSDNGNNNDFQDPWGNDKFQFKKPDLNIKLPGLGIIVVIIIAVLAGSGFFIVKPDEQAVVKRFGVPARVVGPGPHWHIPYPIETIDKAVVTKVHRIEIGFVTTRSNNFREIPEEALMLTGDENIVSIDMSLQYRISDIEKYLYKVKYVENTIKDAAESTIREVAGREKIDELLTVGKNRIQVEVHKILQGILDQYEAGVRIVAVQLQDVEPPKQVVAAFKDVASAREDMNRFINEAEAYRNEVLPRARAEAETLIQEAEAYQKEKVEKALGDVARFLDILKAYKVSPEVTKKRMYLDTMHQVLSNGQKYIFDEKIKNVNPFLGLKGVRE